MSARRREPRAEALLRSGPGADDPTSAALPGVPFLLRPQLLHAQLGFALALVMTVAGAWVWTTGDHGILWPTVFFAVVALVLGVNSLPNATWIRVDAPGLEFSALFRRHRIAWTDIERFAIYRIGGRGHAHVGFDYAEHWPEQRAMRASSRRMIGVEAGLPDLAGQPAADLVELLNAYRDRFATAGPAARRGVVTSAPIEPR